MGLEVSGSVTVPCATGDCTACAAAPPVRLYRLCGCTGCAAVPPKEVTWIVYLHGCNSSENWRVYYLYCCCSVQCSGTSVRVALPKKERSS